MAKTEKRHENVDRFGAVASTACAIHCAVCALAPAMFAAVGLGFLLGHEAEWSLTLVAVAFGLLALTLGWTKHKKPIVAVLLVVGIVGLLAARLLEEDEASSTIADRGAKTMAGDGEAAAKLRLRGCEAAAATTGGNWRNH